ncbi:peptidoglycan-binding domain-containing protein [Chryseobacterium sp. T20]|uniref:peptidoglycan-binding domain-containing protein n=1 Tax=Chryseobacterium sp. T20 TaxID=3395375 RepID=UPI0039BC93F2
MAGNITGDQNPQVGKTYSYVVKPSILSFGLKGEYEWYIYKKQKTGLWKDITVKPKTGQKVTYKFGEIALGIEFQMKVYETKKGILPGLPDTKELAGTLPIIPTSSKVPKIDKVVLFNRGAKDINKASYLDTLIAQAHCIAMFNKEIEFHLWEDDAPGKGHNPVINTNNRHTRSYKARVHANGIAEVQIPLMSDEKILRQIANQFMMKGDRDEGANHEYYITATYSEKILGASQVNVEVINPDYKGQPQNQSKPQKDTPKFPAGNGPMQRDPKGNIIEAVFIDDTGKELSKVAVGDKVRIRIHSKNMVGKHIQYVIWEYDATSNDEVYRSGMIKIPADVCDTSGFIITKDIFRKGIDSPISDLDLDKQNYFIEIISKDLSAESQKFEVNSEGLMKVEKVKSAVTVEKQPKAYKGCSGKYCIDKNSPPSELIREINIRLAGFGGNVPTDKFTDRTEKMVKQFQRDYMKVTETGKVCGNVLRAIDEFAIKYPININEGKCPCGQCSGFGNSLFPEQKNNSKISEKNRKYEYPGIHRSLLWVEKAIKFYLSNQEKQNGLKVGLIFSGYRCNANNKKNRRSSTNHMGKALDLHIYKLTDSINTEKNADKVRDLLIKYTNAEYRWEGENVFALEPSSRNRIESEFIATTWVHYDVRTFHLDYLKDEFFAKNNKTANGENIIALANHLGFQNTCTCNNNFLQSNKNEENTNNKSKWSHSEFGNLIAMRESNDDYNKCNQTKGGLKVINNVKVIELRIKEIQDKQSNRDVFAVGRYQLIPNTLNDAITKLGLDINKKLDQEMQDKIFDEYLIKIKRPKIIAYLEAQGSVEDAMYDSAKEWASIGVEEGRRISDKKIKKGKKVISIIKRYAKGGESYYAGDGLNKAHITPEQIKNVLINSKNENK